MDETPVVTDKVERSYRTHSHKLWRALLLFSGDPDVASDAVAEAFAQALRRGAEVQDVDRWVWRAAFQIARGDLQRRSNHEPILDDVAVDVPTETIDLIRALATLSPKQSGAIVLHHYAGYSNRETAQILGSTTAAVGVHLERGRKRLRQLLGDDDDRS
ncbi:MAG: sigma-70 family RNA polymerase sigma factor [Nocardioidaceae bacterium]